jgi:hypothetical protein
MTDPRLPYPPTSRTPWGLIIIAVFLAAAVIFALTVRPWRRDAVFGQPQDTPTVVKP